MVKLESFEVCLDRFEGRYCPGDAVAGVVYLSVSSRHPIKIKDFSVTLLGEGKTSWVNRTSDNVYDSTEPYLHMKETFRKLMDETVDEKGHLRAGQHRFPFTFTLPHTLPSSYEGEFGHVRYTCLAEVNVLGGGMQRANSLRIGLSSKNKKIVVEKQIVITAHVGINQLSPSSKPDNGLRKGCTCEPSGCCGIGPGSMNAAVSIPKSAFIIGESMPVEVWLENQMRKSIRGPAVVNLVQEVSFHSLSFFQTATDTKVVGRIVASAEMDMPARGKETTKTVLITVPPDLPATTLSESLIAIRYKLRLEAGKLELVLPFGVATK